MQTRCGVETSQFFTDDFAAINGIRKGTIQELARVGVNVRPPATMRSSSIETVQRRLDIASKRRVGKIHAQREETASPRISSELKRPTGSRPIRDRGERGQVEVVVFILRFRRF